MSASPPLTVSPNPRKRPHPDGEARNLIAEKGAASPPDSPLSTAPPTPLATASLKQIGSTVSATCTDRDGSPASSHNGSVNSGTVPAVTIPAKKRKLKPSEKEERERGREVRVQKKLEEKARREEEKRIKEETRLRREEERRQKEEEREADRKRKEEERQEKARLREEDRRTKDEEKRQKDEEKQKREDEKAKKERSQMRLNAFFVNAEVPASPMPIRSVTKGSPQKSTGSTLEASHVVSVASEDLQSNKEQAMMLAKDEVKTQTDYQRDFPSFFLQTHVSLAPQTRFQRNEDTQAAGEEVDNHLAHILQPASAIHPSLHDLCKCWRQQHRRHTGPKQRFTAKEIITRIQGSYAHPIDLTASERRHSSTDPTDLLNQLPVKILQFAEDVRPPYRGTFTKMPSKESAASLSRNPFQRSLPNTNYDYDSEAEWEEPEEGEDLVSEGDEEAGSDDGADEMEDFVDDAEEGDEAIKEKRRIITGDLEPISSGMCWETTFGQGGRASSDAASFDLNPYKIEVIQEHHQFPIDPYSTKYWDVPGQTSASAATSRDSKLGGTTAAKRSMEPPALPTKAGRSGGILKHLTAMDANSLVMAEPNVTAAVGKGKRHQYRTLEGGELEEFKHAVQGSDLTKTGLVEVLKKRFPKVSKEIIKDTLTSVAARVGSKEAEKRWVLLVDA